MSVKSANAVKDALVGSVKGNVGGAKTIDAIVISSADKIDVVVGAIETAEAGLAAFGRSAPGLGAGVSAVSLGNNLRNAYDQISNDDKSRKRGRIYLLRRDFRINKPVSFWTKYG